MANDRSKAAALSGDDVRRMLFMLGLGSALCTGMVLVRFAYVADLRFRFSGLRFNLALAWIPMIFAALAHRSALRGGHLGLWGAGAAWLLFFPKHLLPHHGPGPRTQIRSRRSVSLV